MLEHGEFRAGLESPHLRTAALGPTAGPRPHTPLVAIVVEATVGALETAAVWETFGTCQESGPTVHEGRPPVDFVSATPGVQTDLFGVGTLNPRLHLADAIGAEIVFLAPTGGVAATTRSGAESRAAPTEEVGDDLAWVLRAAVSQGAKIVAVGKSVFTLARTGLLNGRTATTHVSFAAQFRGEFPRVTLLPESLYVEDGPFLTAAGGAATLDLCLHVVSKYGHPAEATRIEQALLTGPRRLGQHGQRLDQIHDNGPVQDQRMAELLAWISDHLHLDLSIDVLSCRAYMSRRSLTRRFRAATGTTPYAWIIDQRVQLARKLLEENSDLSVEHLAARVGFGNPGALRQHFHRSVGRTPTQYRQAVRR